jgi:hypothetical protein
VNKKNLDQDQLAFKLLIHAVIHTTSLSDPLKNLELCKQLSQDHCSIITIAHICYSDHQESNFSAPRDMMQEYPLGFVSQDVFQQQQLKTSESAQEVGALYRLRRPLLTVY